MALHQRADRDGAQIVRADAREAAAVAADRRADRVADEGVAHGSASSVDHRRPAARRSGRGTGRRARPSSRRHDNVVDAEPTAQRLLLGLGDQHVAGADRRQELDRRAGGDRGAVAAVAGEGERRIGEREDEAAVAGVVAVEHVGAHRHPQPRDSPARTSSITMPSPCEARSRSNIAAAVRWASVLVAHASRPPANSRRRSRGEMR